MSHFTITGGIPLCGEVAASGSKNAALPIMAAAILASESVTLENVPRLTDVRTLSAVLRGLGVRVFREENRMRLETIDMRPVRASQRFVRKMRASFCVLGPLLARRRRAVVPLPGGCNIGDRPVNLHLKGLAALGADIRLERGYVVASTRRLIGANVDLSGPRGPTVTGTANVMSAAALARGHTVIQHAATEPEIVDLGRFLNAAGARIEGLGSPTIHIRGVDQLGGALHRLIPDRIEAATLLMAVAITGGSATISYVRLDHLDEVLLRLDEAGAAIDIAEHRVSIVAAARPRATNLMAAPYPGIPTDLQAQWTALMSLADGRCTVQDRVFPSRFQHIAELNRLGADITYNGDSATVAGVPRLCGARVTACDLRASAALVLAGLAAVGHTTIDSIRHLDRGYEKLDRKLRCLGAKIQRESPFIGNGGGFQCRSHMTFSILRQVGNIDT